MIPFFEQPRIPIGPLTIHGFGLAVAAAILFGAYIFRLRVQKLRLDVELGADLLYATLIGGFVGAHFVDVFVYRPRALLDDPLLVLKVWNGISSFGGFFGALAGILLFTRWKRLTREQLWGYCEATVYALPFGWMFGRLGCFMAHDHPGRVTDFFLAVQSPPPQFLEANPHFPQGPFFDLGLLEMLYTILIVLVISYLDRRKPRPVGFYLMVVPVLYAPIRFALDYLRVVDVRYFGFTPGQYAALALLGIAVLVWARHPRGIYVFDGTVSGPGPG